MDAHAWIVLALCALATYSPVIVNFLTQSNASGYQNESKIRVPKIVFPIVWTILYALLSVALFLTIRHRKAMPKGSGILIALYIANIVLNSAWSPVFFKLRMPKAALALTLAMIALASTIIALHAKQRAYLPMALVVPYLAWLLFASYLNILVIKK